MQEKTKNPKAECPIDVKYLLQTFYNTLRNLKTGEKTNKFLSLSQLQSITLGARIVPSDNKIVYNAKHRVGESENNNSKFNPECFGREKGEEVSETDIKTLETKVRHFIRNLGENPLKLRQINANVALSKRENREHAQLVIILDQELLGYSREKPISYVGNNEPQYCLTVVFDINNTTSGLDLVLRSLYGATQEKFYQNMSPEQANLLKKQERERGRDLVQLEALKQKLPPNLEILLSEQKEWYKALDGVDSAHIQALDNLLNKKPDHNYSKKEQSQIFKQLNGMLFAMLLTKIQSLYQSGSLDNVNFESLNDDVVEELVSQLSENNADYLLGVLLEGDENNKSQNSLNYLDKCRRCFEAAKSNIYYCHAAN